MTEWPTIVAAVLAIFAVVGIGAAARRANWLTEEADRTLFNIVVRILLPALILDIIVGNPALDEARNVYLPPLVGFGTVALGFAVAAAIASALRKPLGLNEAHKRRTFALCNGIFNYGYIPLPLAAALFGNETVGVLFVHNLGVEIALWTVGIVVVSGGLTPGWWKRLFNPPILAIALALVLNALPLSAMTPDVIENTLGRALSMALNMLGACAIPMALLLIGATVCDNFRDAQLVRGVRVIAASCAVRLGILPLMYIGLAAIMPGSLQLKQVMAIEAAMPAAVFPIILARHYHGDVPTAVRVVLGTSLISLVTMPLWLSAALSMLGLTIPS